MRRIIAERGHTILARRRQGAEEARTIIVFKLKGSVVCLPAVDGAVINSPRTVYTGLQ